MAKSDNNPEVWLVVGVVVLLAITQVLGYFFFPVLSPWFEQREAGEEIVEQENNAQQALEDYREFRNLYHDIQAQRAQVENSYDELDRFYEIQGEDPDEWSREAEVRHGRIQERITGNQNQLENLVAEYNAMSDDATTEAFKCELPYKVDDSFGIRGPPGSGDAEEPQDVGPDGEPVNPNGDRPTAEECDGLPDEIDA